MTLMRWDQILLIKTWGKTEEKPKALSLSETIYKYTLQETLSKNGIYVDETFGR